MSELPLAIGVDFGGTSVKIGVVRDDDVIDHAPPIATQEFEGPERLLEALSRTIEDLRHRHPGVRAVGVGMPGFVDFEKGIVRGLTNVIGWNHFPLKERLEALSGLPVVVDNDANCMAYAEWKQGAGRGFQHVVAITLGTGVGGGIIANGRMIRGARFGAGEVGQMSIDWQGIRGTYGNLGALEEYIGNQEITQLAHKRYQQEEQYHSPAECSPAHLSKLAAAGDPIAIELWDGIAAQLACALMNCCWLLNPDAIIIGGGISNAGDILFAPLRKHLFDQLSAPFTEALQILPARFGNEAGMIGAAALALEGLDPRTAIPTP